MSYHLRFTDHSSWNRGVILHIENQVRDGAIMEPPLHKVMYLEKSKKYFLQTKIHFMLKYALLGNSVISKRLMCLRFFGQGIPATVVCLYDTNREKKSVQYNNNYVRLCVLCCVMLCCNDQRVVCWELGFGCALLVQLLLVCYCNWYKVKIMRYKIPSFCRWIKKSILLFVWVSIEDWHK